MSNKTRTAHFSNFTLVTGGPGTGKTRYLNAMIASARAAGQRVVHVTTDLSGAAALLVTHGDAVEAHSGFEAVADYLRELTRRRPTEAVFVAIDSYSSIAADPENGIAFEGVVNNLIGVSDHHCAEGVRVMVATQMVPWRLKNRLALTYPGLPKPALSADDISIVAFDTRPAKAVLLPESANPTDIRA